VGGRRCAGAPTAAHYQPAHQRKLLGPRPRDFAKAARVLFSY
jgi:hypothetical protein